MLQDQEFIREFVEEAVIHLENVEAGLLKLDINYVNPEVLNDIFRAVHSIKGSAGFFDLKKIVELAHSMENVLGELRNGKLAVDHGMIELLLKSNDCLKFMVNDLNADADISGFVQKLTDILKNRTGGGHTEEKAKETVIKDAEEKSDDVKETRSNESADLKKEEAHNSQQTGNKSESNPPVEKNQFAALDDSIRVHVTLLNNILNLASEMVLGRNQLLRVMEKYRKSIPGLDTILQNINRVTTELQEKVMQTRMQPIANVFNKFPRIIRDLSRKLNKDIVLNLEGAEVELDKSIIELLTDPLTHLVRNATDHGLELPEVREKCGKPRTGTVTLKAYHEGGYVNIDVIDDGAGIDIDRIKKKALEKDIISKADASLIGEQEILQLLFKPGFSTAEKITDVSGRGVGMDVVKTNIEKLGGSVEVFTRLGEGTTFKLLLPLTLAIIPSIIVEVEGQKFALPQVNLQEIVRIKPGDFSRRIEYIHNSEVLRLREKLLPIVHLSEVLGLNRTYLDTESNERKQEKRKTLYDQRKATSYLPLSDIDKENVFDRRQNLANVIRILVLRIGSKSFGLAVDFIHGSEEILVKALPRLIKECKCYSGVTILGDGKTAMILDPEGIISKVNLKFVEDAQINERENMAEAESMLERQNLLLFKCSGYETFGLDLSLISRIEEINSGEIEKIGEREYIKFRGDSLRVIRLEDYLPVSGEAGKGDKYYVIIPKLVKHPLGILIEKVHDTVQTSIKLNQDDIKVNGIIGSTIINNRIVLLINIYEIFEKADPERYASEIKSLEGAKKTVLIVEDTPFFLKLEKSYLEAAGYNVLTANNGKEALRILQEKDVDEVVSDIQMPVMDGMELIKKIREDKRLTDLPVIAVTSMTGERQKKMGIEAGFDFYEFKLDKSGLLEKIELALKKKKEAV